MKIRGNIEELKIHGISMGLAVLAIILYAAVLFMRPDIFAKSLSAWGTFFIFFLPFAIAIIGVLGILDSYLPPEIVSKFLGDKRKIHG